MAERESSSSPGGDSYAAGLIDGEGYIGIQFAGGSYQVRLKVAMTDKGLPALRRMHQRYGGFLGPDREATKTYRASFVWRLNGQKATALIQSIRSELLVKSEPATIALAFQAMVDSAERRPNGQAVWTPEMHAQGAEFRRRIQEANRKGPDPDPIWLPPQKPLAVYRAGSWWDPEDDLFGPVEFKGGFPLNGQMIAGHVYEVPPWTAAAEMTLLPTPRTSDTNGSGQHGTVGPDLRTVVEAL